MLTDTDITNLQLLDSVLNTDLLKWFTVTFKNISAICWGKYFAIKYETRHVFVKTRMTPAATKWKYGKISKSYIMSQSHPQGHVMSVKCEQALDELTIQVW